MSYVAPLALIRQYVHYWVGWGTSSAQKIKIIFRIKTQSMNFAIFILLVIFRRLGFIWVRNDTVSMKSFHGVFPDFSHFFLTFSLFLFFGFKCLQFFVSFSFLFWHSSSWIYSRFSFIIVSSNCNLFRLIFIYYTICVNRIRLIQSVFLRLRTCKSCGFQEEVRIFMQRIFGVTRRLIKFE